MLPLCLAEIDRSRPYLIGMLGQRHGWVPDQIAADLVEQIGWLPASAGKSVTELEIIHGVLHDPGAAQHAYFLADLTALLEARFPAGQEPSQQEHDAASGVVRGDEPSEDPLTLREQWFTAGPAESAESIAATVPVIRSD